MDDTAETYIEIEVSPNNVLFDSFIVDTLNIDVAATSEYDLCAIRTAVHVDGTVNDHGDVDRGWLVEIAMPFAEIVWELLHCLADDVEIVEDTVEAHLIA